MPVSSPTKSKASKPTIDLGDDEEGQLVLSNMQADSVNEQHLGLQVRYDELCTSFKQQGAHVLSLTAEIESLKISIDRFSDVTGLAEQLARGISALKGDAPKLAVLRKFNQVLGEKTRTDRSLLRRVANYNILEDFNPSDLDRIIASTDAELNLLKDALKRR